MKKLIIFGTGSAAREIYIELAHHPEPTHTVVAFAKDDQYVEENETLYDLPVVPFGQVHSLYPPDEHEMMIAVIDLKYMETRIDRYNEAKAKGYHLASCVSAHARVWPTLNIGDNCFIGSDVVINPSATIGDNVFISPGIVIPHDTVVGDHSFFAVGVTMAGCVTIEPSCFFGAGAILRNNVTIGHHSVIGTGAVIVGDTEPYSVYMAQAAEKVAISSKQLMGG